MSSPLLLPPPTDNPREIAQQALTLSRYNPTQAAELLQEAATRATRQGDPRMAALILHRRAALALRNNESPVPDLAMAARLLEGSAAERALLLLDLGQALIQRGDVGRATLTLRESERLARQSEQYELAAAARHLLGEVAASQGEYESARTFLRGAGQALIFDVERDLLATLRDMGNLPHDLRAEQERNRRQQAIEDELAALKRELDLN